MSIAAIPNWNAQGVLPPINPASPVATDRSPYSVSLTDLVLRFGTTPKRQLILDGFLNFRAALHTVGLIKGFRWVDGSFLEDIKMIEGRDPVDIDVVTFFHLPAEQTQESLFSASQRLFAPAHTKQDYWRG